MQDHHAIVAEQLGAFVEKAAIVIDADMLEHADRDDPVEAGVKVPVILQTEFHRIGQAAFDGAATRQLELFLGQRDAGDVGAAKFGKIKPEPAPAAADVENALPCRDLQLGRKMPLLRELCIVE